LIERGHIYIAQPPLYKVKRGGSEQYLKDERAREDYLIVNGLDGAVLRLANGVERGADDLRHLVDEARLLRQILAALHMRYDRRIIEQAAIADVLRPLATLSADEAQARAALLAKRLDAVSDETERGWQVIPEDNGYMVWRHVRGVRQASHLDAGLLASAEARRLADLAPSLREAYADVATFIRRNDETLVAGPTSLVEAVMAAGQKGISQMQRYKGLGEMNPEQLWETTLDRNVRSLLQVRIREVDEADNIFVKLMGDVVEPRREFIQENALSVANLDV
jgi:DNA gyrase subunit B